MQMQGPGWTRADLWMIAELLERGNWVKKVHIFHRHDVRPHNTVIFGPPHVRVRFMDHLDMDSQDTFQCSATLASTYNTKVAFFRIYRVITCFNVTGGHSCVIAVSMSVVMQPTGQFSSEGRDGHTMQLTTSDLQSRPTALA